jgi:DNA (cytosine-5)-methyltransferase 1
MVTGRPRLLDLFCGEGGAGAGYAAAGWDVTGVDWAPRAGRHYPFPFIQAEAVAYLAEHGREYDAIHASPPCQVHSKVRPMIGTDAGSLFPELALHPDLLPATRAALAASGRPYIIENVPGAPLLDPVLLCGTMFGLAVACQDGVARELQRHRLFESSVPLAAPGPCAHQLPAISVIGHSSGTVFRRAYSGTGTEPQRALGVDWVTTRKGIAQAIPPAFTEHLGRQLLAALVSGR